jgi:ATP-dependent Clp protease ATP-binding subunit ClpC
MFERFTERARQVVVLAQDEARALRHNYIGTEHLLLGLICEEEGLGARTLESLGVTLEQTRDRVRAIVGEGEPGAAVTGQIPFTPDAKHALELALREALTLGHNYIGTEHVLLGLVLAGDGVGFAILEEQGVGAERVREKVLRMLGGPVGGSVSAMHMPPARRRRRLPPFALLVTGWLLFAFALGLGVLVGWAIWG